MHDWTLKVLAFDWANGLVTIYFNNRRSQEAFLVAEGTVKLSVPRREEWGGSVSVNDVKGPETLENGNLYLCMEMQSGDKIELEARSISMPER